MTTYSLNGHTLIAVKMIGKPKRFEIDLQPCLRTFSGKYESSWINDYPLPEGIWSIIGSGLASEITHEDWEPLVEWFEIKEQRGYRNYMSEYLSFPFNPKESGESWLLANGLEKNCTVLLILK